MIVKGYLFSLLYGMACLLFAALLHKIGVRKWITRKVVHILVGFEWIILQFYVGPTIHFLTVCLFFLLILLVAYLKKLMPMISSEEENAPGTVYYALAMSIMACVTCFVPEMIYPFGIGVFCTSLGDGIAGLVGQSVTAKINPKIYGNKSLFGAVTNFLASFLTAYVISTVFNFNLGVLSCLVIALLSLELELFTGKGFDNVTITLGTAFLSYAFMYYPSVWNYIVPILITPTIIAIAHKKKALTVGGILSALALDVMISLSLGNFGFVILFAFFALGLVTDKIKKTNKKTRQTQSDKKAHRNHVQVMCNGLVGGVAAILYFAFANEAFLVAFVAAFSEALADTAGSGIGSLSDKAYDVFHLKKCPVGLSGGMSIVGTFSSLVGAAVIALIAFSLGAIDFVAVCVVTFAGFLGSVFDSFLGSLVQVKYKCKVCGKITEKQMHCEEKTGRYCGLPFVNNNTVNFLGTLFAAVIAFVIYKVNCQ